MEPTRFSVLVRNPVVALALASAAVFWPLTPSQAQPSEASQALAQWLTSDCEDGDLKALTRWREAAVSDLIAALNKGPAFEGRERVRQLAEESYDELVEQAARKPEWQLASNREEYVNRDVDNFDAQFRVRAAQALIAINTPEARKALESFLSQIQRDGAQAREDVRMTILALLNSKPQ
ncbi:MAG TPA: hypothetical protein VLV56_14060 [Burkholderiales bacterium]|nr:hypothetical protein [Burkholderiales bacterium]